MKFTQFGKYTMLKKLTTGGMAEIFLATDMGPTGVGRFVVIKRVLPQFSESEEFKDMFKNEGKVASNLKHRNIAPVYEFGIENSQFFLSMEYVAGRNLRELIKKTESLRREIAIESAVYIIKEAASGLNYAHNAIDSSTGKPLNLIHRDVSPQNIMLSFDGEIKLIDFGISKIADTNLTRAGHLKGKFSYMSPEQARGESLDPRTDIFCLGVILWEMLAGARLFSFKNEMTALKKIKACDIPNIQKKAPRVPTELAEIVHRALHKNKNARYKTAAKMEKDLNVFLNKRYPNFSQYDFISFIKQIYSKDILKEREKQKNYSKEFKKHLSYLNESDRFQYMTQKYGEEMLSLPSIDSVQTDLNQSEADASGENITKTQTEDQDGKNQIEKERASAESKYERGTQTFETEPSETHLIPDDEQSGYTAGPENTISQMRGRERAGFPNKKKDFGQDSLVTKNAKDFFLKSSTLSGKTNIQRPAAATLSQSCDYKADTLYLEDKKRRFIQIASLAGLALILAGSFLVFKSRESLMRSSLLNKVFSGGTAKGPEEALSSEKESAPQASPPLGTRAMPAPRAKGAASRALSSSDPAKAASAARRRVLIRTKPSGAMIYVDDKFLSYTPSTLSMLPNREVKITIRKSGYRPRKLAGDELQGNLYIILEKRSSRQKVKVVR